MEDPGFCEMADYIDNSREELLEKLTPPPSGGNGSKQVMDVLNNQANK